MSDTPKHLKCEDVQARLFAYMDECLPESLLRDFDAHIEGCPKCSAEILEFARLWDALDSPPIHAPDDLKQKVWVRIEAERNEIRDAATIRFRRMLPVSIAVAAVFLVVGGWLGRVLVEAETANCGQTSIATTMDIFAPAPKGTFVDGFFAMFQEGR